MTANDILSESLEDYLETILELETTHKVARAKDIAESIGVKQGSVTGALKTLAEKGLINYEPYSFITLTRAGNKIANKISKRHKVLRDFLFKILQVNAETAEATACRMEHSIDDDSLGRLICFIKYINECPRTGPDWLDAFVAHCAKETCELKDCERCMDENHAAYLKQ